MLKEENWLIPMTDRPKRAYRKKKNSKRNIPPESKFKYVYMRKLDMYLYVLSFYLI